MNKLASDLTDIADAIYHHNGGTVDDSSYVSLYGIANEIEELVAENAKLRELVKRMHGHIKENCDICDGWYCSSFDEDNECCVYDTLARELGIEVDE